MTRDDTPTQRQRRPIVGPLLSAGVVWLLLVPGACLLFLGLLVGQGAQANRLATEGAHSRAELATVAAQLAAVTAVEPADQRPAAEALTPTLLPESATPTLPMATPTLPPPASAQATLTSSPTASATATATPLPTTTATPFGALVIGYSVAGRPLTVTQFGTGPVVRLIVAGIHGGNERNTIALADALIAHLRENPARVPADVTLYILRALNPDGNARGTDIYARANDNNVDLNRNWPSHWQADWSREGCWKYLNLSGGSYAGSEPEVQALMAFMLNHTVAAVISYHSAALGIFAGGQPPDEASLRLADAVAQVSDYPYPPLDFGCVYTGQLIDWASEQGVAALDVELANHRDTDFEHNLNILDAFLAWRR